MEQKHDWFILDDYNHLSILLEDMDIPEARKDLTKLANIRWLNRNIAINREGPLLERAQDLIRKILKENRHV